MWVGLLGPGSSPCPGQRDQDWLCPVMSHLGPYLSPAVRDRWPRGQPFLQTHSLFLPHTSGWGLGCSLGWGRGQVSNPLGHHITWHGCVILGRSPPSLGFSFSALGWAQGGWQEHPGISRAWNCPGKLKGAAPGGRSRLPSGPDLDAASPASGLETPESHSLCKHDSKRPGL